MALIYHCCVEMGVYVGVRLCLHSLSPPDLWRCAYLWNPGVRNACPW